MDSQAGIKLILSAYVCRPDAGSEPETGWGWAIHLARAGCQVYLLTAGRNQKAIERVSAEISLPSVASLLHQRSRHGPHEFRNCPLHPLAIFHFASGPAPSGHSPLRSCTSCFVRHCCNSHTAHTPRSANHLRSRRRWPDRPTSLLSYFGKKWKVEWLRSQFMHLLPKIWLYRSRVQRLSMVFVANSETKALLRKAGCKHVELLCDTGVHLDHCSGRQRTFVSSPEIHLL